MIPKCFVINMPSAQDRRESMTTSLNNLGISFEFFEATNGRELTPDQEKRECKILCVLFGVTPFL